MKRKQRNENIKKLVARILAQTNTKHTKTEGWKYCSSQTRKQKTKPTTEKSLQQLQKTSPTIKINELYKKKLGLEDKIQKLKIQINSIPHEDKRTILKTALDNKRRDYNITGSDLSKTTYEFIHGLKKDSVIPKESQNKKPVTIALDTNAVADLIDSFVVTHHIKNFVKSDLAKFVIISGVKSETKRQHVTGYSNEILMEELKGVFGENMTFLKHNPELDESSGSMRKKYSNLSNVDSRVLAFAKRESAIVVTNDRQLKRACGDENIRCFDQRKDIDFFSISQTKSSNFEDWVLGKISRMKKYWNGVKAAKTVNNSTHLEKRNQFKLLLSNMFSQNFYFRCLANKIYFDGESMPKTTEGFFDSICQKPVSSLEETFIIN